MRIQSKFKDYYDHVGQRFGQDPDVVYIRGRIQGDLYEPGQVHRGLVPTNGLTHEHFGDLVRFNGWYMTLVVAGPHVFPILDRGVLPLRLHRGHVPAAVRSRRGRARTVGLVPAPMDPPSASRAGSKPTDGECVG